MVQPSFYIYSFMKLKVLYAILDWGLGHATRSETIIQNLKNRGADITIASKGLALNYLQDRFQTLRFLELPDKEVKYSRSGASWGLLRRSLIQKDLNKKQKEWTKKLISENEFDLILSDNVYGVYHDEVQSILITHQLKPISPILKQAIAKEIANWINCFHEVWIPDFGEDGIAGSLLQNPRVTIPKKFLGNISRFKNEPSEKEINYLGIISGPEPQARLFKDKVLEKFKLQTGRNLIAYSGIKPDNPGKVEFVAKKENNNLMRFALQSRHLICRSGYTSILDILKLGGNALIIPTPGQTEQEYLARRMNELGLAKSMSQKAFERWKIQPFEGEKIDEKWGISNLDSVLDNLLIAKMPFEE